MSEFFSGSWYRVASLRPRLRSHAQIHRHHYRGELWYVLQDHASGRFHRFSPMAHFLIGGMNGQRTVDELWQSACQRFGDDAPSQDEVIGLLAQLHAADVLLSGVPSDSGELNERTNRQDRQRRLSRWRSPLSVRIPIVDPDRLLARGLPLVRWIFSPVGALLWLLLVGAAALQAAMHWSELTQDITDRVLALENLLLLALIFPFVKLLHELGHAFAVKAWGGEVHEMGIMLLVFVPIPYVDASAASAFRARRRRVLVGAAGMMVELALAAIAMFVWLGAQPGPLRAVAFNTMLIAGVSTVLFNGNPLLRFDGYYILMDWLEIPNLASRANQYLGYLVRRYGFGLDLPGPDATAGEKRWFVPFAIGSFVYRICILTVIILFVASQYFVVGLVLAVWAAVSSLLAPLGRMLHKLLFDSAIGPRRTRAVTVTSASLAAVIALLVLLPVPHRTAAEGVLWVPPEGRVTAGAAGIVTDVLAGAGDVVAVGQPLVRTSDPALTSRVRMLRAQVAELEGRYDAAFAADRVAAATLAEELALARERLKNAAEREAALVIESPADGVFVLPSAVVDLPGRYLERGSLVGYVVERAAPTVRVVVPQDRIDLVRQRTEGVELRLADDYARVLQAEIWSEVPSARTELPSPALSLSGGGRIATDPAAGGEARSLQPFFEFELRLDDTELPLRFGGRAYVRFAHGNEPLAYRWYRRARQVLLEVLSV
jgi:putative peptide zinc metalloprotease protein